MKTIEKDKIRFGFDASWEPVEYIESGETVCFKTQDCYAEQIDYDKKDFSLLDMKRNNPVTGPLYVNGAEPGDVLKVEILDIVPEDHGVMCVRLNCGVYEVVGCHCRRFPIRDNTIYFDNGIEIPIRPMIGVIGTCPVEPCDTQSPGEHGGNLDINDLGIGCTVYLPVSVPGALLAIGDCHAVQGAEVSGSIDITVQDFFTSLFSDNIFSSFTEGNILQTLVIAIIVGVAILMMKDGESKEKLIKGVNIFNDFVGSWIGLVMKVSPIGVLFLMGDAFGEYGLSIFKSMAALAGTFYIGCLVQIIVVYGGILFLTTRINPIRFMKDSAALWSCTLATCSSVASIPVNLKTAKEKFNVPDRISSFTIPLGSQVNADGNAIFDACLVIFIAQTVGVHIGVGSLVQMVLTATLLSMGGNGIPGSGIVKTLVLVQALGLPVEIVGIVAAFYRVFDMGMTTNNCLGDLVGTVVVSKLEERREARKANKAA